jgi:phytoene dehydrogenase-like protein
MGSQSHAPLSGIAPGEVALLQASVGGGLKLSTRRPRPLRRRGVVHVHDAAGHIFAGWITFSADGSDGATVAQTQVLMRAQDPLTEIGLTLGGTGRRIGFWQEAMLPLAARFGVARSRRRTWSASAGAESGGAWETCGIRACCAPGPARRRLRCDGAAPRTHRLASMPDAIVVGSGPNGLAAAVALAQAGLGVEVLEAAETPGGGTRSAELTLPGFVHDVCSAIHPLAVASPFLRTLPLAEHGVEWVHSPAALAHPFDDGPAVLLERSPEATAETLGEDGQRYRKLLSPLAGRADALLEDLLAPLHLPRHPAALARFGPPAGLPAALLARTSFRGGRARGLFAGLAAHSMLPLTRAPSAGFGLVLGLLAHAVGWPLARGGSQAISDGLVSCLRSLGGEIETDRRVESLAELGDAGIVLLDITPRQFLRLAGARLRESYRQRLERYRYGPGAFKLDWALGGPIPWRAEECARAATVHLGATFEEIVASEREPSRGSVSARPFVLLAQQSLFDPTRAPAGKHTAWAYCHVPNGSTVDMTEQIERQIERFAPGFRDLILARAVHGPAALERRDANYVGGDINGGAADLRQLFARPTALLSPYATPLPGVFLCSSSTPPGGGVHGMCGYHAARLALSRSGIRTPPSCVA